MFHFQVCDQMLVRRYWQNMGFVPWEVFCIQCLKPSVLKYCVCCISQRCSQAFFYLICAQNFWWREGSIHSVAWSNPPGQNPVAGNQNKWNKQQHTNYIKGTLSIPHVLIHIVVLPGCDILLDCVIAIWRKFFTVTTRCPASILCLSI